MTTRKRLAAVVGTYQKDGKDKSNYMSVGTLVQSDNGDFIELNPFINFTSLPRKEGKLYISVFSDEGTKPSEAPKAQSSGVTDEIPF